MQSFDYYVDRRDCLDHHCMKEVVKRMWDSNVLTIKMSKISVDHMEIDLPIKETRSVDAGQRVRRRLIIDSSKKNG